MSTKKDPIAILVEAASRIAAAGQGRAAWGPIRDPAEDLERCAKESQRPAEARAPIAKPYRAEGKARMSLLPGRALRLVAEVLTIGAERHGDTSWKSCASPDLYLDAAERHLSMVHDGVWIDGDGDDPTYVAHAACAIADLLIYLDLRLQNGSAERIVPISMAKPE